jgi:FixJ family two-component response regulator
MSRSKLVVAIVDDEDTVRRALERLFRSAGIESEVFSGGGSFLDSLRSHHPDCVVLDLHMPGVTGFDVQARLRELDLNIPVVVITGHDTPESRGRVRELGAAVYLRKPVAAKALLEAIENAIGANHSTTP